jgi:hypothetical protein
MIISLSKIKKQYHPHPEFLQFSLTGNSCLQKPCGFQVQQCPYVVILCITLYKLENKVERNAT